MNRVVSVLISGVIWPIVLLLVLGLFSLTVFNNSHNEQMYVTAAYLLTQGQRLYSDFAFVQMPYTPQIYALIYALTGAGYYLFKAKIVNYVFLLVGALLLLWQVRRESDDWRFTSIVALLFFSNYYLFRTSIEASNYTMPIAFSLAAYVLFTQRAGAVRENDSVPNAANLHFASSWVLGMATCGFCLALATGAKLYYATLFAPFGLAALLYPTQLAWTRRLRFNLLPMAAGAVVGLLPVAFYAWGDPERVYFNNLGYHMLNTTWREQNGFADMTLAFKLGVARDLLANPNFLVLVLWLLLALLLTQHTASGIGVRWPVSGGVFLSGALSVVATMTAFTPSPLFPQYFAMPVPFILAWMAALYAAIRQEENAAPGHRSHKLDRRLLLRRFALASAVVTTLVILPRHTLSLQRFFADNDAWAGVESVAISHAIHAHLDANGSLVTSNPPKVATLSPVYALETHLAIYPEFATGSFVYRIGDLLNIDERRRFHAPSVSDLAQQLNGDPPAAILITQEGDLEIPLETYAQEHGYRQVDLDFDDGKLYLR